jgi:hypothetical protein
MKWFLVVYIFLNGDWVPGETMDGWAPHPMASYKECRRVQIQATGLQALLERSNPQAHWKRWECEQK